MGKNKKRTFSRAKTEKLDRYEREQRRNSDFELTSVICARCGKDCEVPFKPTNNRPVFCRGCFKKPSSSNESGDFVPRSKFDRRVESKGKSSEGLDKINQKLDKIMRALKID